MDSGASDTNPLQRTAVSMYRYQWHGYHWFRRWRRSVVSGTIIRRADAPLRATRRRGRFPARRDQANDDGNTTLHTSIRRAIIAVAFSLPVGSFRSSGSISSSHTPSKGSGRVRHRCSGFACDGNGPHCHHPVSPATAICALNARSSQPWPLPFPVSCLPYVSASIAWFVGL